MIRSASPTATAGKAGFLCPAWAGLSNKGERVKGRTMSRKKSEDKENSTEVLAGPVVPSSSRLQAQRKILRELGAAGITIESSPDYGDRKISKGEQDRINRARAILEAHPDYLFRRYKLLAHLVHDYRRKTIKRRVAKAKKKNIEKSVKGKKFVHDNDDGGPVKKTAFNIWKKMKKKRGLRKLKIETIEKEIRWFRENRR